MRAGNAIVVVLSGEENCVGESQSEGGGEQLPCDEELDGHGSGSRYNLFGHPVAISIRVMERRSKFENICAGIEKIDLWKGRGKDGAAKREYSTNMEHCSVVSTLVVEEIDYL